MGQFGAIFNGLKLLEIREARAMTITQLSELSSVSRQSISSYEKDLQKPRIDIIEKFANILNVPVDYFFKKDEDFKLHTIFFRSLSNTTNTERTRLRVRLVWIKEIIDYLKVYFQMIPPNIPQLKIEKDFKNLSRLDIEKMADICRNEWSLGSGPISNIVLLLENNGVIVTRSESNSPGIDAFSEWNFNELSPPIIFLGKEKDSAARSRFDAAHELGHLVLHSDIGRDRFTNQNLKLLEEQANYFASAFLLPSDSFANSFYYPTLDSFLLLKKKWNVSIGAMIMRSTQLELISEQTAKRLWMAYSRKGYRKNGEPLDDTTKVEEPRYLTRCIDMLLNERIKSKSEIMDDLKLSQNDLETLLNLPKGYFDYTEDQNFERPKLKIYNISAN